MRESKGLVSILRGGRAGRVRAALKQADFMPIEAERLKTLAR
jgi:hypothetical protein